MYNSDRLKCRRMLVRILDDLFFEPGNMKRCHKRLYERLGRHLFPVSYDTFLKDLNAPFSPEDLASVPKYVVDGLKFMVEAMLQSLLSGFGNGCGTVVRHRIGERFAGR